MFNVREACMVSCGLLNSQAEVRVVAWAGPVPTLKALFERGEDVHLYVCKRIAKYVQDNKITMPTLPFHLDDGTVVKRTVFRWKPWDAFTAEDPERYTAKRTVHANNYGMGPRRYSVVTSLPEATSKIVQEVYFTLFPEVRGGYQTWIQSCLRKGRRIETPQGFRKVFYDIEGPELLRAAYAFYPQTTVGLLLVETLTKCCTLFHREGIPATPENLRACGLDIRLQMHDSVAISVRDDPSAIRDTALIVKQCGERPLTIRNAHDKLDTLTIPMDFKVGRTLRERQTHEEEHPDFLRKYKLEA